VNQSQTSLILAPISLFHIMKEIQGYRHTRKLSSPEKKEKEESEGGYIIFRLNI